MKIKIAAIVLASLICLQACAFAAAYTHAVLATH